jgi:signal transduction histidine kinase/ligand-binding sensor domain-containing protein
MPQQHADDQIQPIILRHWWLWWALLWILGQAGSIVMAQQTRVDDELGQAFIQYYSPKEYKADPQNWCFAQDKRGMMYIGNSKGLIEFDGTRWKVLMPKTSRTIRSVAYDQQRDIIYVGSTRELGYFAYNANTGEREYHSLVPFVPAGTAEFTDVWTTAITPDGVFFYTDKLLLRWHDNQLSTYPAPVNSPFFMGFAVRNHFYVYSRTDGLFQFKNKKLELVPNGKQLEDDGIFMMLPLGNGNEILCGTRNHGLMVYNGKNFFPFKSPVWNELKKAQVYTGCLMSDGSYALATLRSGLYIINAKGELLRMVNAQSGLQEEMVLSAFHDREGILWLALNNGIAKVMHHSPITIFDETTSLKSGVTSIQRHKGRLYVGTYQGLFYLNETNPMPRFELVKGGESECYDLHLIDNDLWAVSTNGVKMVIGSEAKLVLSKLCTQAYGSQKYPGIAYVSSQNGLAVLAKQPDGQWKSKGYIEGFEEDVRSILEDSAGELWMSLYDRGIARIDFSKGPVLNPRIQIYDTAHGLTSLKNNHVFFYKNRVLFATSKGVMYYDKAKNRFLLEPQFKQALGSELGVFSVVEQPLDGSLWLQTYKKHQPGAYTVVILRPQTDGSFKRTINAAFTMLTDDAFFVKIFAESTGVVWACSQEGLFRYDNRVRYHPETAFQCVIQAVEERNGSTTKRREPSETLSVDTEEELDHHYNLASDSAGTLATSGGWELSYSSKRHIRFLCGALSYVNPANNQFRYRLLGLDEQWGPWTTESQIDYTSLSEGDYTFEAQARNGFGTISSIGRLRFSIDPPWYRSWWAYGLYAIVLIGSILSYTQYRTHQLKRQQRLLQLKVIKGTQEVMKQKAELEASYLEIQIRNQEMQDAYAEIEAQNSLMDSYGKEISRQNIQIESAIKEISTKNDLLNNANHELLAQKVALQNAFEELAANNEQLEQANVEIQQTNRALNASNAQIAAQKSELEAALQSLNIKSQETELANTEVNRQKDLLQQQYNDLAVREAQLQQTLSQLKNTQAQVIMSEKIGVLGKLIAGIAHEINTPMGAIQAAAHNAASHFWPVLTSFPDFYNSLPDSHRLLFAQLVEQCMNSADTQLSSREERQLRKSVTHKLEDLNIPEADNLAKDLVKIGIGEQLEPYLPMITSPNSMAIFDHVVSIARLRLNLDNILNAVGKTQKIIFALKSYAYRNSADEIVSANVVVGIQNCLTLYHNMTKHGIEVRTDFDTHIPDIFCYPDELNQVWINILHNAITAMNGVGVLEVHAWQSNQWIHVSITDNGPGIAPEHLSRVFEAFYTTKPQGEGTGLGLHISSKIVEKHHGTMGVTSEPGKTTFTVHIPIYTHLEDFNNAANVPEAIRA